MSKVRLTGKQKKEVAERAGGCCEYCYSQIKFSPDPFSVEHIIPRAAGGTNDMENLCLSCQGCNNRKYMSIDAIDPASGEREPLYNPRQQRWSDHFAWSEDFTLILGQSPTGRATVEKLQLNREGVVNLRKVLCSVGKHPPPAGRTLGVNKPS